MAKAFDLGGLLEQASKLQERFAAAQQELASRTVEGRAGGGMVTATVTGRLEVLAVSIDPSLLENPDRDMIQDLVVAAVNDGIRAAQQMMAEEMSRLTGGLRLPGMP